MLAAVEFSSPLVWAILIGWIMSVVLHEFAHGIVAYWGGDYTVRERGGLTLNPLQYVDPMMSLILPVIFLMMGGIPLPGGATYVRTDLLRSRFWQSAVSLAGPGMNVLIFLVCVLPLHPALGLPTALSMPLTYGPTSAWSNTQIFLGVMAVLQVFAVVLNLVPVPPLDGFNAISPFLPDNLRERLMSPPLSQVLFFGYFLVIWRVPKVFGYLFQVADNAFQALGFDANGFFFFRAFFFALYGQS